LVSLYLYFSAATVKIETNYTDEDDQFIYQNYTLCPNNSTPVVAFSKKADKEEYGELVLYLSTSLAALFLGSYATIATLLFQHWRNTRQTASAEVNEDEEEVYDDCNQQLKLDPLYEAC
jgi:hypothetical protein